MSNDPNKQAALEAALKLVKENPDSADNWNRAAVAALQLANLEDAAKFIGHAIAIEPTEPINFSNRARVLFAVGREREALSDYTRAIELLPSPELYSSRAVVNLALGKEAAALSDLSDAIDLAPSAENYLNRAAFFGKKSMASDALRDISAVIELIPDNPNHRLTRANLAFSVGLNELAMNDIEKAIQLDATGTIRPGLLQLADQLEAYLKDSPQPEVSIRLIKLIREEPEP